MKKYYPNDENRQTPRERTIGFPDGKSAEGAFKDIDGRAEPEQWHLDLAAADDCYVVWLDVEAAEGEVRLGAGLVSGEQHGMLSVRPLQRPRTTIPYPYVLGAIDFGAMVPLRMPCLDGARFEDVRSLIVTDRAWTINDEHRTTAFSPSRWKQLCDQRHRQQSETRAAPKAAAGSQ